MNDKHVKQSRPMTSKPRSNSTNKAQVVFNQKARGSVGTYSKSHAKIQPPAITKDELKKTLVYLEKNRKFGSYSIDGHEEPAGVRIGDYHVSNNTLHAKWHPLAIMREASKLVALTASWGILTQLTWGLNIRRCMRAKIRELKLTVTKKPGT